MKKKNTSLREKREELEKNLTKKSGGANVGKSRKIEGGYF